MKTKLFYMILLASMMLCYVRCNSETHKVESHLEEMLASPIVLKLDQMQCRKKI